MSLEIPNFLNAMAKVTHSANGGAVLTTFVFNRGFTAASCTHTALGVYAFTLDAPLTAAECCVMLSVRASNAADNTIEYVDTSDAVKTVTTLAAGAAVDTLDFDIMVFQRPA